MNQPIIRDALNALRIPMQDRTEFFQVYKALTIEQKEDCERYAYGVMKGFPRHIKNVPIERLYAELMKTDGNVGIDTFYKTSLKQCTRDLGKIFKKDLCKGSLYWTLKGSVLDAYHDRLTKARLCSTDINAGIYIPSLILMMSFESYATKIDKLLEDIVLADKEVYGALRYSVNELFLKEYKSVHKTIVDELTRNIGKQAVDDLRFLITYPSSKANWPAVITPDWSVQLVNQASQSLHNAVMLIRELTLGILVDPEENFNFVSILASISTLIGYIASYIRIKRKRSNVVDPVIYIHDGFDPRVPDPTMILHTPSANEYTVSSSSTRGMCKVPGNRKCSTSAARKREPGAMSRTELVQFIIENCSDIHDEIMTNGGWKKYSMDRLCSMIRSRQQG